LLHNSGDIDNRVNDSSAMYLGAAAHREIQKSSGKEYKKEVSLKFETEIAGIPILIQGRADGITYEADGGVIIDEIKTTGLPLSHLYTQQEKHLAQAKCYACLFLKSSDEPVSHIAVQLTYFQLESKELKRHKWEYSADELEAFFRKFTGRIQ
jgi:DNA excision repair protein ERCC-2